MKLSKFTMSSGSLSLRSSGLKSLSLVALAVIAASSAAADDAGWYVGGNVGRSDATIDEERIRNGLLGAGFATSSFDADERDFGYKVFGGYQFNKYFALEGGYFDLGEHSFTANTSPAGTLSGRMKAKGANLDALGFLPITEKFSAFARVGVNYADANDEFSSSGAVNLYNLQRSDRKANIKYGLGVQHDFTRSFAMRAELERYRVDNTLGRQGHIDLASLGVLFRFGAKEPVAPVAKVATPAPAPAPVLVVVPAPARTQEYCSILDFQFEVNQDEIQREEQEKLGVIGTFLKKYPDTTAVIEGHTDNIGTPEQNMRLSQRRAESVVTYLTDTFQIARSRLTPVGYGETRPIGDNLTDGGKRMNRRIGAVVACANDIEGLTVVPARITMAMLIEFDRNRAEVKPQYRDELAKVAAFLKANPSVSATVEGHTGNLEATSALAMEISQRRAQNVVNYLVDNFGIARSRLTAEGFGQARRFAYNTSAEGQQENRRVNIIIDYPR